MRDGQRLPAERGCAEAHSGFTWLLRSRIALSGKASNASTDPQRLSEVIVEAFTAAQNDPIEVEEWDGGESAILAAWIGWCLGELQGTLNAINGVTDTGIGTANQSITNANPRGQLFGLNPQIPLWDWSSPITFIGALLAVLAVVTGGRMTPRQGILAVGGGATGRLLRSTRRGQGGAAMTLGHVILARDQACFDRSWTHERFHGHQFERWDIFLLPAYWLVGFLLRCRGYDPYLDKPFEPPPE